MSLDIAVIMPCKISDKQVAAVHDHLIANGFDLDEYGYYAREHAVRIYEDPEPEKNEYWAEDPPSSVWFTPLSEYALESRHNQQSHELSYRVALEVAKLLEGYVYDVQLSAIYDCEGSPCGHYDDGQPFDTYGHGMKMYMAFTTLVGKVMEPD